MSTRVTVLLIGLALLASACAGEDAPVAAPGPSATAPTGGDGCEDGEFYWLQACTPAASVDVDTIISGGPPPDGIPPIDAPRFETVAAADEWLEETSPVQVVTIDGRTKAYPLAILTWHEIVNDRLAGVPIVVTYCPLCNSGLVFERTVAPPDGGEEEVLDFGTSGRLRHSNLVMYDRQHRNLWQQFDGEAIVGAHFLGARLERLPSQLIGFGELARTDPDAQVLSRETGASRDYGRNPYVRYDAEDGTPFLYRGPSDARLDQMERVVGIGADTGDPVAVVLAYLRDQRVVELEIAGQPVVLFWARGQVSALDAERIDDGADVGQTGAFRPRSADGTMLTFDPAGGEGSATFVDRQSGSVWNLRGEAVDGPREGARLQPVPLDDTFWFVWFAFQPETRLVGADDAG